MDAYKQKQMNKQAWAEPQVGDYWHEKFCPYFLIVDIQGDIYTVLCANDDPVAQNAKISDNVSWSFDYSKHSVVNKDWIRKTVKYDSNNGFVADVVHSEKMLGIIDEWRRANPTYVPVVQKFKFNMSYIHSTCVSDAATYINSKPSNPVGYWILDPSGIAHIKFLIYKRPTDEQIKNTEELLGWKWQNYE